MKVYTLTGKSGTGKSFQAMNLCREYDIESIIDDGIFIYRDRVMAGTSTVRVWQTVTVAWRPISIMATGLPTTSERPMTTARLPRHSMP